METIEELKSKLIEAERKLSIAIPALKFYSQRENWTFSFAQGEKGGRVYYREILSSDTHGYEYNGMDLHFGGKIARKAIFEIIK
jgi:hypothetical protein